MKELDLQKWRAARLQAAIEKISAGNRSEFGRRLGYKDGAFIRQMLSGDRPIREKTIVAIQSLPGMRGWFSGDDQQSLFMVDFAPGNATVEAQLAKELTPAAQALVREISDLDSRGARAEIFLAVSAMLCAVRDGGGIEDLAGDD